MNEIKKEKKIHTQLRPRDLDVLNLLLVSFPRPTISRIARVTCRHDELIPRVQMHAKTGHFVD